MNLKPSFNPLFYAWDTAKLTRGPQELPGEPGSSLQPRDSDILKEVTWRGAVAVLGVVRGAFQAEETIGSLLSPRALGIGMSVLIINAFGQCSQPLPKTYPYLDSYS